MTQHSRRTYLAAILTLCAALGVAASAFAGTPGGPDPHADGEATLNGSTSNPVPHLAAAIPVALRRDPTVMECPEGQIDCMADGPTPFPIQATSLWHAWLGAVVRVARTASGTIAYIDCYDPESLDTQLGPGTLGRGIVAKIPPHGWELKREALRIARAEFEAALAANPDTLHWTNEDLTAAFRQILAIHGPSPSMILTLQRAVEDTGLVAGAGFFQFGDGRVTAATAPSACTELPCCGSVCGSCDTHRCDCGICGEGDICSCYHVIAGDTCAASPSGCEWEEPISATRSGRLKVMQ